MLDWNAAQNILCIRLDTIGDVIMTTPAMHALKADRPDRRLTLMTSSAGAAIAPLIPDLDGWIEYDAPWLKATAPRPDSAPEYAMIERLRQAKFDAAIIFTVYSQNPLPSAFLCYMAGIPLRLAHCHENPYQLLTHWVTDPEPGQLIRHEVRRQLDLVASIGCQLPADAIAAQIPVKPQPELSSSPKPLSDQGDLLTSDRLLHVSNDALHQVQQLLIEAGIDLAQPWVVIHPGATASSRRYPPEGFAIVTQQLVQMGVQVLFTGTQPEIDLVESIRSASGVPSHSLVDRLSLAQLTALLSIAPLLLSNNTGPVHIASAIGTPVVDLYALTNPQHTPWNVPNRVLYQDVPCRNCYKSICPEEHHHCLRLVAPDAVVQAVCELLDHIQPGAIASVSSSHASVALCN
jgi:ADP-heptose:LPS heptosyltransferase